MKVSVATSPVAPDEPVIELRELTKSFPGNPVLRGVSLEVAKGESFALIGGSGTGKSVILKCILGLIPWDGGIVRVNGNKPSLSSIAGGARIGMLFQGGALFDSMTVFQNVAFQLVRGPGRVSVAEAREIAARKLERVGLEAKIMDLFPSELSGGMQKRAGLARAIATDPDILFFDEPTTGLDPIRAAGINRLISGIVGESGTTGFTITHDMSSVRTFASKVALLHSGQIVWNGAASELDTSDNSSLRQFVEGSARGPLT